MSLNILGTITRGDFSIDVDFSVSPGETLALVGHNGAGKSSVLSCIAGLVPLDSGALIVDGATLDCPAEGTFTPPEHRGIGMVFQQLHLFPHLSVRENIEFALHARGLHSSSAETWLNRLHLEKLAGRRVATLSGGEAQRVALARALAPSPRLLLLDEPLSAVDSETRGELRETLGECLETFGGMAILVSHDSEDVASLSTLILSLSGP